MNTEQKKNIQVLTEEEYTKVYAGIGNPCFVEEELMTILPEVPTPPSGHKIDL